jgi:hypothetical protein
MIPGFLDHGAQLVAAELLVDRIVNLAHDAAGSTHLDQPGTLAQL